MVPPLLEVLEVPFFRSIAGAQATAARPPYNKSYLIAWPEPE